MPGNPATVDPPDLDSETHATGGTLAAGSYEYAVTDQFKAPTRRAPTSPQAYVDRADHRARRRVGDPAVAGDLPRGELPHLPRGRWLDDWSLIGTYATPSSATLPDNSSGDPVLDDRRDGRWRAGAHLHRHRRAPARPSRRLDPPTAENANESPWEQNPYFIPALEAVGITAVGDDASKAYPNPPDTEFGIGATYTGAEYAGRAATFIDGTAQVVPRHPINIYYNTSTEAQEVDEYNTLYLPPSLAAVRGQLDHDLPDDAGHLRRHRQQRGLRDDPEHAEQRPRADLRPPDEPHGLRRRAGPATSGTPPSTARHDR